MNPEPSERLSERGPGTCPGPGTPGCWRGMKRRKNSWISSSSMPGICGSAAVRRTACVVLILTTVLPCSSTRRVKSGSTCVCARTVIQDAASHSVTSPLRTRIVAPCLSLVRTTKFDRVSDALHAHRWRLPNHGHHVIRDLASIDVDRAHAREPGAHRIASARERLDEHRHRRETVRIHQLPDRPRLAEPALELAHLVKAGKLAAELPAGAARRRRSAVLDAPAAGVLPGPHHVAAHRADGELREHELLDRVAARIERDGP